MQKQNHMITAEEVGILGEKILRIFSDGDIGGI